MFFAWKVLCLNTNRILKCLCANANHTKLVKLCKSFCPLHLQGVQQRCRYKLQHLNLLSHQLCQRNPWKLSLNLRYQILIVIFYFIISAHNLYRIDFRIWKLKNFVKTFCCHCSFCTNKSVTLPFYANFKFVIIKEIVFINFSFSFGSVQKFVGICKIVLLSSPKKYGRLMIGHW